MKIEKISMNKKMNKKGVFGLNAVQQFFVIILGIALLAYVIVIIMGTLSAADIIPQDNTLVSQEEGSGNTTGYTLSTASLPGFTNPVIGALSNRTDPQLLEGEIGHLNATTYTLARSSTQVGFTDPVIVAAYNRTDGTLITSGNYTLTGNVLTNASATEWMNVSLNYTWTNVLLTGNVTVSSLGVVTNASATEWASLNITYTYTSNSNEQNDLNSILGNTSEGITGFFSAISPVYAILAVLVIILVLVVLVRVVQAPSSGATSTPQL